MLKYFHLPLYLYPLSHVIRVIRIVQGLRTSFMIILINDGKVYSVYRCLRIQTINIRVRGGELGGGGGGCSPLRIFQIAIFGQIKM